jgi:hypothetical protein
MACFCTIYRTKLSEYLRVCLSADNLARGAVADVLDRGSSVGLSLGQLQQVRAIYDLSDETRQYLASTLSRARHMERGR